MKHFVSSLSQRGDSIVEVMITIAVISSVLVGAYIATNQSTERTQDAQERSQAVEITQGQIESLRSVATNGAALPTSGCFTATGTASDGSSGACVMHPNGGTTQPAFTTSINANTPASGTYKVVTTWDSLSGKQVTNNVTMYYRPPTP